MLEFIAQLNLVAHGQFNVDALNAVGVLRHAGQRNDHIFVNFEGIGVAADGGRFFAILPKLFARFGADGNEAFATSRVGNAHHFRGDFGHIVGVVARNVRQQKHLGKAAAF